MGKEDIKMKEGYIVWNQTNYGTGFEFFGVYKSKQAAERHLRRVVRNRFGKCPRNLEDLMEEPYCGDSDAGCADGYGITKFEENNGEY